MASISPVVFILGAGGNIGHHVARAFAARGYKVALAARSLKEEESTPDRLNIQSDLNVNTVSAFVAAQQALQSFEKLPSSAAQTFIYTGNILNTVTMPPLLDLGVGKSATAHIIESAAAVYGDRGFK